jgi:hypothetical protein
MNGKSFKGMGGRKKNVGNISDKEEYTDGRRNTRLIIRVQP